MNAITYNRLSVEKTANFLVNKILAFSELDVLDREATSCGNRLSLRYIVCMGGNKVDRYYRCCEAMYGVKVSQLLL